MPNRRNFGPRTSSGPATARGPKAAAGGGAPPPAFDPKSISGCAYQFDPSDAASVTLVGGDIDIIYDLTGNWALYAGGVTSRMPMVEQINGLDAARFHAWPDGDYLRLCDAALGGYQNYSTVFGGSKSWTNFVVLEAVGAAAPASNTWQTTGLVDQGGYLGFYANGGTPMKFRSYYYAATASPAYDTYVEFTEAAGPGVPLQLMMKTTDPGGGGVSTLYASMDGGAYSSVAGGQLYRDIYYINEGVGYGMASASYFDGRVGETIAYDRELTAGEVTQVTDYLRTKWGLR